MTDEPSDVVIIGAGLSGLTAARTLAQAGRSVLVLDKGRSVGGRLATRRMDGGRLDHGAQFFTVRGDDFGAVVAEAVAEGIVHEWCRGFGEPDGFPRYAGSAGMNGFAKWLASAINTRTSCHVDAVSITDGQVVVGAGTDRFRAPNAIITAPVPQTLALLDAGDVGLSTTVDRLLRSIDYFATLALLVTFDTDPGIAPPGGVQMAETEPFTFIGDNRAKGISERHAVTFHANHDYSLRRYNDDPDNVRDELADMASRWFANATPVEVQLKKWRYAGPVEPLPERVLLEHQGGATLLFAGDAFGGPKVEGAFNSGLAAARAILETAP